LLFWILQFHGAGNQILLPAEQYQSWKCITCVQLNMDFGIYFPKRTSSFWAYLLRRHVMNITMQYSNCLRGPPYFSSLWRICSQIYFKIQTEKTPTASHCLLFKTYFQHSNSFCHTGHSLSIRKANPQYFEHVTKNYGVDWFELAQDRDKWPALLYTVINFL